MNQLLLLFVFLLSVVVWIILSFCQKRTKMCLGVCTSRPAVVSPINFLNPRHRFVYALVCASLGSLWLNLIKLSITQYTPPHTNKWISSFVSAAEVIGLVVLLVLMTYPMLACVEAPIPIVGYTLGLIHSILYNSFFIVQLCDLLHEVSIARDVIFKKSIMKLYYFLQVMPQIICIFMVSVWYAYKLLKEIRRICVSEIHWKTAIFEYPSSKNNLNYVKALLNRLPKSSLSYFELHSKIHLPLPVLIATAISIVVIIQLTVLTSFILMPYILFISDEFHSTNSSIGKAIEKFVAPTETLLIVSSVLATVLTTSLLGHLVYCIRKEIKLIRRGKSELCEDIHHVSWPMLKLASYVCYTGRQVAAFITGWLFYHVTFLFIGIFIGLVYYFPKVIGYGVYYIVVVGIIAFVIWFVQAIMCYLLFLSYESTKQRTIVLNNRRIFNYFTYSGLLYNIATGLYTNFIRIITGFLLTLLIMPRLDKVVYVKPFQWLDSGYQTYCSFMITEAVLNNPVVHVFIDCLVNLTKNRKRNTYYTKEKKDYRFSLKAKNRWLVAYTLLKNPVLLTDRKPKSRESATDDDAGAAYTNNPVFESYTNMLLIN